MRDLEYFENNFKKINDDKFDEFIWKKPFEYSPSFHKPHSFDEVSLKNNKNTLEQMAPYIGFPHSVNHSKWDEGKSKPPKFMNHPQRRKTTGISTMNQ